MRLGGGRADRDVGSLVLFSTATRDAWLLDAEDDLALCVCRDGVPQPVQIVDTPDQFGIHWTACFQIDGDAFIVASGREGWSPSKDTLLRR
jgi:hypothetical protein